MDDTENYLNSILKKRLGSVVNYNGSSKTANTVTRIPKQQQKTQNMPTVFRKKHQSVYHQSGYPQQQQTVTKNGSYYQHAQSQYMSMKQPIKSKGEYSEQQLPEEEVNRQTAASQRVEYMLISKRIQSLKEDQHTTIMPTVDVTNYHHHSVKSSSYSTLNNNNPHNTPSLQTNNQSHHQLQSRLSSNTSLSKRKRIFGAK